MPSAPPDGPPLPRALLVDDERPALRYLADLLSESGQAQVVATADNLTDAAAILEGEPAIDLAFVDIEMASEAQPEQAGLTLVRRFVGRATAPVFVLATAHAQHAAEAFDLGVVDYLLKPFDLQRVVACLQKVATRRSFSPADRAPTRIVARAKDGVVFFAADEVWAFGSDNRLVLAHTATGQFDMDVSLRTIESSLAGDFLRVHRAWLVNRRHVAGMRREDGGTLLRVGSLEVPVSRDRVAQVRAELMSGSLGLRT